MFACLLVGASRLLCAFAGRGRVQGSAWWKKTTRLAVVWSSFFRSAVCVCVCVCLWARGLTRRALRPRHLVRGHVLSVTNNVLPPRLPARKGKTDHTVHTSRYPPSFLCVVCFFSFVVFMFVLGSFVGYHAAKEKKRVGLVWFLRVFTTQAGLSLWCARLREPCRQSFRWRAM